MTLTGGKRRVNASLKAWVAFVKKVQKEEKLSYKDAIHRAKQRKDKGEKWMKGGEGTVSSSSSSVSSSPMEEEMDETVVETPMGETMDMEETMSLEGGRRRSRTARRARSARRGRTMRRGRARGRSARRY
jgi:hypothetical protein